jgi:hypothetical protein
LPISNQLTVALLTLNCIMEGDTFNLMIYSVKQLPEELLANADAVLDYLEKEGKQCGETISFLQGTVFKFFEAVKEVTTLDLLDLVGGGQVGAFKYPREEELCCGAISAELTIAALIKLKQILNDPKLIDNAKEIATKNKLNPEWFTKALATMSNAFEMRLRMGGSTVGFFE